MVWLQHAQLTQFNYKLTQSVSNTSENSMVGKSKSDG